MTETGPVQTFDDAAALPRLRPQPGGKVKVGATELGGQGLPAWVAPPNGKQDHIPGFISQQEA